jgi:hypothetical protein
VAFAFQSLHSYPGLVFVMLFFGYYINLVGRNKHTCFRKASPKKLTFWRFNWSSLYCMRWFGSVQFWATWELSTSWRWSRFVFEHYNFNMFWRKKITLKNCSFSVFFHNFYFCTRW